MGTATLGDELRPWPGCLRETLGTTLRRAIGDPLSEIGLKLPCDEGKGGPRISPPARGFMADSMLGGDIDPQSYSHPLLPRSPWGWYFLFSIVSFLVEMVSFGVFAELHKDPWWFVDDSLAGQILVALLYPAIVFAILLAFRRFLRDR